MMLVSDIVNSLVASELKPLSISNIGGDLRDQVQEDNFRKVIDMVNVAYSAIYEKFALLQKEFLLQSVINNKTYALPSDFVYPISAALEDGTQVSLNDERKIEVQDTDFNLSLMFPEPFLCLVKGEDPGGQDEISLIYCAEPVPVKKPHDTLKLTSVFKPALMAYVGYRGFLGLDGSIEGTNNTYYMRFMAACKEIVNDGLDGSDNLGSNVKLDERGWV